MGGNIECGSLEPGLVTICHFNGLELRSNMKIKYLWPLAGLLLTGCVTRTTTVNAPPPGPTLAEVQSMVQAHVSDSVIVTQIQNSSARYALTADQIIALKNAGVSDAVLNAMINTASKPPVQSTTTVIQSGYVYPYVYTYPWPWWGYGPYYYGGYYRGGYYNGGGYHGGGYHGGGYHNGH